MNLRQLDLLYIQQQRLPAAVHWKKNCTDFHKLCQFTLAEDLAQH